MIRLLPVLLFFFCGTICFAQQEQQSEKESYYELNKPGYNMMLKVNPPQFINGHFPINLEYRLSRNITVEFGVALTHYDILYEADILADNYERTDENRRGNFGYGFGAGIRYYPSDFYYPFEEWFLGADFRIRQYYTDVYDCAKNNDEWLDESRTVSEFRLLFGYMLEIGDNVVVECYGGTGIRAQYLDRYICIEDFSFSGLSTDPLNGMRTRPAVFLGAKFAVGL